MCVIYLVHTVHRLCHYIAGVCLLQFPDISSLSGKAKHVKALHRLPGSRFKAVMMDRLAEQVMKTNKVMRAA